MTPVGRWFARRSATEKLYLYFATLGVAIVMVTALSRTEGVPAWLRLVFTLSLALCGVGISKVVETYSNAIRWEVGREITAGIERVMKDKDVDACFSVRTGRLDVVVLKKSTFTVTVARTVTRAAEPLEYLDAKKPPASPN